MNPSTIGTGFPLPGVPTDLTSDMSDATIASLLWNVDGIHCDTAATPNSEFPLDLMSFPQFDPFSTWLNDPSPIDYSFMGSDVQASPPF